MSYTYKQFIAGQWVDAHDGGKWDVLNPATEEIVRTVPFGAGQQDTIAAIEAAKSAFPEWSRKTPYERADILKKTAELIRERLIDLANTLTAESGKPLAQAIGDWRVSADLFEWFAEEGKRAYGRVIPSRVPGKRMSVIKQPIGVVGVITAWNFPAYNPARAWAAALAAGCTVVAKCSEYTPLTGMEMAGLLVEAGISAGVINLVNGNAADVGEAMLEHKDCRKLSFTGSTRVGHLLVEGSAKNFTRLNLELGGNAPVIIFPDTDIEALAKDAVAVKYGNNGQVCVSPQRFFVHNKAIAEFTEHAAKAASQLKVGNGFEEGVQVGPLINRNQLERIEGMMRACNNENVDVLTGGERPEEFEKGYFFQPTVITNLKQDAHVLNNEIFGPIMPILGFDEFDEVMEQANATEYGLASYVWTNDLNTATRASEQLEFGMVGINAWYPHGTEVPFVGVKQSGLGHESGQEGLEGYMESKLISIGGI
ncbi:MAG: NAD-dependent succinate-semialdehyde dehydrogenase [Flavobacteriales bacterium]|nr:NAD-dependent succinate-semialdehyde dehydrogenase [Flavobacteriales bacterium]